MTERRWVREPPGFSTVWLFNVKHKVRGRFKAFHPTGSKYMCDPPSTDTDEDWVVLTDNYDGRGVPNCCPCAGCVAYGPIWDNTSSSQYDDTKFLSYKKEINGVLYNLIVTEDEGWYDKFVEATMECKKQNLLKKEDRIALFEKYLPREEVVGDTLNLTETW